MREEETIIIGKLTDGDDSGFRGLFDLYYKRLFHYAISYLDDDAIAEDLVQDLFLSIWEKKRDLNINSSLSSYLYTSVHNRCIQHLRKRKVREKYKDKILLKQKEVEMMLSHSSDFTIGELDLKETQAIVDKTLRNLPEKTREIFQLSRKQYLTNAEIAEIKEISIKTVEYHISSALKSFRKAFGLISS